MAIFASFVHCLPNILHTWPVGHTTDFTWYDCQWLQPRLSFPRPFQQSLSCFRVARSLSNSWASCYYVVIIVDLLWWWIKMAKTTTSGWRPFLCISMFIRITVGNNKQWHSPCPPYLGYSRSWDFAEIRKFGGRRNWDGGVLIRYRASGDPGILWALPQTLHWVLPLCT